MLIINTENVEPIFLQTNNEARLVNAYSFKDVLTSFNIPYCDFIYGVVTEAPLSIVGYGLKKSGKIIFLGKPEEACYNNLIKGLPLSNNDLLDLGIIKNPIGCLVWEIEKLWQEAELLL
jgi:hypothetical protein